ncbi:MAG: sn-glycerol-3-phosphate ABC transporter ATP-binding protein UgpC [Rhodospirillales bacterium]|nr:sn-glycerol-3-phosphate ABC transporter ATP-binding protein UgpC [Rhodospirillales bacterium]
MATVDIRSVRKAFDAHEVIHGVSVLIEDREFVVLVGPSGCGKSTLLRMIAGLEDITLGEIAIGGRVVNDVRAKERDIAMVFQNYALYPHMSVYKNMAFSLRLKGMDRNEIDERVRHAAKILNLGELLDRQPRQLSGGQRQRVAMGRAIVRNPKVFLFDEPLSNLDAKLRVQMRTEIKDLHLRLGATTVYVTHDQLEAMTMADRIVVMSDGNVEQIGAPLALYDHPDNVFVAGFLGSPAMNFFKGTLRRTGGEAWVEGADGLRLPLAQNAPGQEGRPVVYGIRPEHLKVGGDGGFFECRVIVVETTGSGTQVVAETPAGRITAAFDGRYPVRPGESLRLHPQLANVHLFDATTTLRMRSA